MWKGRWFMSESRLLILNKNESENQNMAEYFGDSNYSVISCTMYKEAVDYVSGKKHRPDLVIFEMDVLDRDSYEMIDQIRHHSDVPMIVISCDDRLDSQLYAYSKKIDDYIVKPIPFPLLEAHVEAILRRSGEKSLSVERAGALSVDYEGRKIYLNSQDLKVTTKEFDLLEYFIKHKGMVLTRDKLLDSVWGYDYIGGYRSVDTLVKKLRAKLTKEYPYIKTVYGVGYCFDV